ncbi:MAG TPA: glucose-6-phosphate dehydrogenase [Thermoanaerobaculia bacterium]|nr:glucose-6-phosphate dehydrogenase [Thermoanaerobaculia bacterium]
MSEASAISQPPGQASADRKPAPPCVLVIFGASGDLAKRKLIPAVYNLAAASFLPDELAVLGISRSPMSDDEFRQKMVQDLHTFETGTLDQERVEWLKRRLSYVSGDLDQPETFERLRAALAAIDEQFGTGGSYLFYLAVPPSQFAPIIRRLGDARLTCEEPGKWRRVVIEKPFGHDLESARRLNHDIREVVEETQIFRIDHYLGKETVQNILAFRFANGIFEPIWNRRYIDDVQITVAETVGVESRGSYYEEAGALRDMVQNHMFQLLALTAMEPPISFAPDVVRDERVKILRAVRALAPEDVLRETVRGQYGPGMVNGKPVPGYRAEQGVSPNSHVETYVALKLFVDNWRWADVPFYLRTGKHLPKRVTEVAIQFKRAPFILFRETPVEQLEPNVLVLHIQPDEGISLSFEGKGPGPVMRLGQVRMGFRYSDYFGSRPETGYETLLYDCMAGDSTLFQRSDLVEVGWTLVMPILDVWSALAPRNFPNYAANTWGPRAADDLIQADGRRWKNNG